MPTRSGAKVHSRREEKKAATREQLLAAGVDLVAERGFHATSLDAIAAEAGLTKGAVYSNFASKAELFMEIAARVVPDTPAPEATGDLAATLADALVAQAHDNLDHWRRLIEFVVFMAGDPALRELQRTQRFPDGIPAVSEDDDLWHGAAVEAAAAGLLSMRLIYGAELISDDLIRWTIHRLAKHTHNPD
jgi:AcrR family transcriptional regulator